MSETRAYTIAAVLAVTAVLALSGCRTEGGQTCRDGSHSTATGKGACSHHGGVKQ